MTRVERTGALLRARVVHQCLAGDFVPPRTTENPTFSAQRDRRKLGSIVWRSVLGRGAIYLRPACTETNASGNLIPQPWRLEHVTPESRTSENAARAMAVEL